MLEKKGAYCVVYVYKTVGNTNKLRTTETEQEGLGAGEDGHNQAKKTSRSDGYVHSLDCGAGFPGTYTHANLSNCTL